jgi:hypothetical protein
VVEAQVPVAAEMSPDLVSLAAGGNDILRRRFDLDVLAEVYDGAIARLVSTGATVVIFTPADPAALPGRRPLLARIEALLTLVHEVAAARGALLVDLWSDEELRDRRMWSVDRLHLSTVGHHRVAAHVLDVLGISPDPGWRTALPPALPDGWIAARRDDLQWARQHLAPWLGRRIRGRSSGDTVAAKRPALDVFAPGA